jgi:cytochrome c nitrite reductase small subunit
MAPFPNEGTAPLFSYREARGVEREEKRRSKFRVKYLALVTMALVLVVPAGLGLSGAASGPGSSGAGALGVVARGLSFLSDDPKACVGCHVMETQYEAWFHAPHRGVTTCNDCHLPNGNPAAKWLEKARAGAKDTIKFWAGAHAVNVKAAESTKAVVQANCLRCHSEVAREIRKGGGENCSSCHRNTSHPL